MDIYKENGFSLIELLAVIGIFFVLATISLISWNQYGPIMSLKGSAQALGDAMDLGMMKAHAQKNEFFVLLNYDQRMYRTQDSVTFMFLADSFVLVNDDGWDPNHGFRTRIYNAHSRHNGEKEEFRAAWEPNDPDFGAKWRNNNLIESREVLRGPLRLNRAVNFLQASNPKNSPVRIVFSYRQPYMYWHGKDISVNLPIADFQRREEAVDIYLCDRHFKRGVNTLDNRAHLRAVRVTNRTIEVLDRPELPA